MYHRTHTVNPPAHPRAQDPGRPPGPPPRILIVEDDASVRKMLARILAGDGYRVRTVADGTELREDAAEAPIQWVLLDLHRRGPTRPDFKAIRLDRTVDIAVEGARP